MEAIGLDRALNMADAVITGEGRSDSQTLNGKVPQAVASLAAAKHIPVFVISGDVRDCELLNNYDAFTNVLPLRENNEPVSESIINTPTRLEAAAAALALNLLEERP